MKAAMETFFADRDMERSACEVRISDTEIVVSFDDDNGSGRKVVWSGHEVGPNRWLLTCAQPKGSAALSRSALDSHALEGSWFEGSERGMWVIDLEVDDQGDD